MCSLWCLTYEGVACNYVAGSDEGDSCNYVAGSDEGDACNYVAGSDEGDACNYVSGSDEGDACNYVAGWDEGDACNYVAGSDEGDACNYVVGSELRVRFRASKTDFSPPHPYPVIFSDNSSKAVSLPQFFFLCASVVSYVFCHCLFLFSPSFGKEMACEKHLDDDASKHQGHWII